MLVTLLLGIAAGWGSGLIEDHVQKLLVKVLKVDAQSIKPVELRSVALGAAVFVAAVVAWILATPHAVALGLGVLIGVLFPRLRDMIKAARAPDYDA